MCDYSRTMLESVTSGPKPSKGIEVDDGLDITIKIPVQPRGKGRPRSTTKHPRVYTPKTTREYQREIWAVIQPQIPRRIQGALRVDAVFMLKRPKSKMGRKWAEYIYCLSRPDIDNCCKALWDSCAQAFDDQHVVATTMLKVYTTKPGDPQLLLRIRRPPADISAEIHRIMFE